MRFNELNESMYSQSTYAKVKKPTAPKVQATNDVYVDISEESENSVAITLKGRTALIPAARARKLAEKLNALAGQLLSEENEIEEDLDSELGLENKPEDNTKNDPPQTENKGVSAREGMVG